MANILYCSGPSPPGRVFLPTVPVLLDEKHGWSLGTCYEASGFYFEKNWELVDGFEQRILPRDLSYWVEFGLKID